MEKTQLQKNVTGLEIFKYGFGSLGVNLMYLIVSSYAIYFLTDVAGISVAMAGTIFLFSRIVDAIFDPIIGAMSDRTKTKWGRYRPFMMFGSFLGVAVYILLFTTVNFGDAGNNIYYFIIYSAWSIGYTLMVLPYQSIVSIVAKTKKSRNFMVMSSKFMALPAGLVAVNIFPIIESLGGGSAGWFKLATITGIVIVPCMWICASCAKRFDTKEEADTALLTSDGKTYSFKEQLKVVTTNKALLMLIIAFGTNNLADASIKAVQSYFAKYVLEDMSFVSTVGNMSMVIMLIGILTIPFLARVMRKRDIFILGTIIHIFYPIALFVLDPKENVGIITILAVLSQAGGFICNVAAFMMLPDCVDFGKLKTGLVSAGLVTSAFTFSLKAGAAIGGTLASYTLGFVGFEANAVQSATVLAAIVMCLAIPSVISDVASLLAMVKYPIDERTDAFLQD